jgi:hypothetical protein
MEPINTSRDGANAIRMVSLSRSSAHMPRVTLRTVEPAKELACQSVEKRCTRVKASWATSDMILSVNGTIAWRPISLSTTDAAPSATMAPNATSAARRASGSDEPRVRRIDQMSGEYRHEQVGDGCAEQAAGHDQAASGLLQPVPEYEGQHHAYGRGPF